MKQTICTENCLKVRIRNNHAPNPHYVNECYSDAKKMSEHKP
jgi:hypothetical protein